MRSNVSYLCFICVSSVALLSGCQGRGELSGKVTFKDKALAVGSVLAVGSDGVPRNALIENGSYRIEDLPTGTVKLAVTTPRSSSVTVVPRKPQAKAVTSKDAIAIPEKYAAFETSELTCTIRGGRNSFDIKLE